MNKRNINKILIGYNTLLHNACLYYPRYDLIKGLIDNGSNVNITCFTKDNALMLLCFANGNRTDLIRLLVESGTNLLQVNGAGEDVLKIMYKYASGNLEGIKYLKQKIRELNERLEA